MKICDIILNTSQLFTSIKKIIMKIISIKLSLKVECYK